MKNIKPVNVNRHIIADLYEIQNVAFYDKIENMRILLYSAAYRAKMAVVGEVFKQFTPSGSSGVLLLAESHASYHLWATEKIITIDIFTCGEEGDPQIALDHIIQELKPNMKKSKIQHLDRSF